MAGVIPQDDLAFPLPFIASGSVPGARWGDEGRFTEPAQCEASNDLC